MISSKHDQEADEREVIRRNPAPRTPIAESPAVEIPEEKKYSVNEMWRVTERVTNEIINAGGEIISVAMNCWGLSRIAIKPESFEAIFPNVKPWLSREYANYLTKVECVSIESSKYLGGKNENH